jgi:hypothetical protein
MLLLPLTMLRFVQSDLFTFYIGEERQPFIVHSKAVAATSRYFDRLVHGGLSEAQTRSAELKDTDPDTFVRFLEYAYRLDYIVPQWTQDNSPSRDDGLHSGTDVSMLHNLELPSSDENVVQQAASPGTLQTPLQAIPHWNNSWSNSKAAPSSFGAFSYEAPLKKLKKLKKDQMSLRSTFYKREYINPVDNILNLLRVECEPKPNTSPKQDFTPVFLAHARLYTLADMRMVHPLKALVLHKLHKTLVEFELYHERLGDVVELAKYAYDHGEDRAEDGTIDALRDMVVNYIVCEMKVLGKHAGFRNLMDGGGEFAGDFWDIVRQELL